MQEKAVNKNYSLVEVWPGDTYRYVKILKVDFLDGITVEIMNLGGVIRLLEVPDKNGNKENVVLNYDSINSYFRDKAYLGCIVGRYANRIRNGSFNLNGIKYQLLCNKGSHHLHGGYNAFDKQVWKVCSIDEAEESVAIELQYLSQDGEEGYPGNLEMLVRYIISKNSVKIEYKAKSDKNTIFNPTNHSYFNLSGDSKETIDDHWLQIGATRRLVVDEELIPNGNLESIKGSAFDFTEGKPIGTHEFDTCYELVSGALLWHEKSGRELKVETTFPGLQLYTGDYLGEVDLLGRSGVCLEAQFYPDSPNHPEFPNTILKKGEAFSHYTTYSFNIIG